MEEREMPNSLPCDAVNSLETRSADMPARRRFLATGLGITAATVLHPALPSFGQSGSVERSGRSQAQAGSSQQNAPQNWRSLGSLKVSPIGLGCMSMMSGTYNPPRSKEEMIAVIRGAVEMGVTLFDTAEI